MRFNKPTWHILPDQITCTETNATKMYSTTSAQYIPVPAECLYLYYHRIGILVALRLLYTSNLRIQPNISSTSVYHLEGLTAKVE